jgi:L,D-peptidoglycan transpeptidase YkuD (ErfK/YbiS/YcfS/YnhG family)
MDIIVKREGAGYTADWGSGPRACAVGRGGIADKQREGDGITPLGVWPLRRVLYRADRIDAPRTGLPLAAIAEEDAWCDVPGDPNYNRPVRLPYPSIDERLWREDGLYDVLAVVGFNDNPIVSERGSAIFLHVARDDYSPTAGCVALKLADLLEALAQFKPRDRLVVTGG